MLNQEKETFSYTYNAKDRAEVEKIRKKYMTQEENKMETLRALDAIPQQKASIFSLILGVLGALVFGTGMSFAMVWTEKWFILGIAVGVIGIIMVALAYPLYQRVVKKEREKIAPEILSLTEELMK